MESLVAQVAGLIDKPVGLPRENPTESYWQREPHQSATIQSKSLPDVADFVVIGSGMTGVAAAKALLEADHKCKVVVVEARAICSGATGRNGGHLKSSAVLEFSLNCQRFGREQAEKIVEYQKLTCNRVEEIARHYCEAESEIRNVESIGAFEDSAMLSHAMASICDFKANRSEKDRDYRSVNAKDFGVHEANGAIASTAGAMWPYRLVTNVWQVLREQYPKRLHLEAYTPATSIVSTTDHQCPLLVHTPRGVIRTRSVLHCTNGFTSKLVPGLGGKIFPVRGTMTVQEPPTVIPNHGADRSWAFLRRPTYNRNTGLFNPGLEYLTQNAKSGLFFYGGEEIAFSDMFTDDDTSITESSKLYLCEKLGKSFGTGNMELIAAWAGIMGFTGDGVPLIGHLPAFATGRDYGGEFIAAGFNGYGMPTCWLAGEAIAELALGRPMPAHVPQPYIVTNERLESLTPQSAAAGMLGDVNVIPGFAV